MMTFASDREWCRVIVEDVTNEYTLCLDFKTGNERKIPTAAPGGLMPLVGDIWLLTKENGTWELLRCLDRNVDAHHRSMSEVLDALERSGLIRWRPDEADDVLSRHGTAFIGEMRFFVGPVAPVGWLLCDGSLQTITRWRRLYRKIGTTYGGDGITTFGMPNFVEFDTARSTVTTSTGAAVTGIGATEEIVNDVSVPARPRAGTVTVNAHLRVDRADITNVCRVRMRLDTITGSVIAEWYIQGSNTNSVYTTNLHGVYAAAANTARTVVVTVFRESGTGNVQTYSTGSLNNMSAIYEPTPAPTLGYWRICAD